MNQNGSINWGFNIYQESGISCQESAVRNQLSGVSLGSGMLFNAAETHLMVELKYKFS